MTMKMRTILGAWFATAATAITAAPFAYQPNDQHQLQVIDLATGGVSARIQLPGTSPIGIGFLPSGGRSAYCSTQPVADASGPTSM